MHLAQQFNIVLNCISLFHKYLIYKYIIPVVILVRFLREYPEKVCVLKIYEC